MKLENHCIYNGSFSRCSVGVEWEDQKDCPFAVKSPHRNCCMFLCNNIRCDSLSAQMDRDDKEKDQGSQD